MLSGASHKDGAKKLAAAPIEAPKAPAGNQNKQGGRPQQQAPATPATTQQQAIHTLVAAQDAVRHDRSLAMGRNHETHCAQATARVVRATGAPYAEFNHVGIDTDHNANAIGRRLAVSPDWKEVSQVDAQDAANRGITAVGSYINPNPRRHGHLVTVRPENVPGDPTLRGAGILINNIGNNSQIIRSSGFHAMEREMHFYVPK